MQARERRVHASKSLESALAACAEAVAQAAVMLADRFSSGGTLFAIGTDACAPDADHIAVEFAHPVIVGKRALPAVSLREERALERLASPGDVALGLSVDGGAQDVLRALEVAHERGLATIALAGGDGGDFAKSAAVDHLLLVGLADPLRVQEGHVTLYHLLWELVQAQLEGEERVAVPLETEAAALYPFLGTGPRKGARESAAALRRSVAAKLERLATLRDHAFASNETALERGARLLCARLESGGRLLAFGNGGSSTDADSAARLFRSPPRGRPARARALTDAALVTALANDAGFDVVFARQIAAFGRPGDAVLGFSTSGDSENVVRAFEEAGRRGLTTLGLAGYAGGRMAAECRLDALLVVSSDSVHRIQEVQRSLLHALWEATCAS